MPRKSTSKRVAAQTFERFDPAKYPNLTPQQQEEEIQKLFRGIPQATYAYDYWIECTHPYAKGIQAPEFYLGSRHSSVKPWQDTGYMGSCLHLDNNRIVLGPEFFKKNIFRITKDRQEAFDVEGQLHQKYLVDQNPKFFNDSVHPLNGRTGIHLTGPYPEKMRQQISETKTGVPMKPETRELMKTCRPGFTHSEESKQKMSEAHTGVPLSEAHKASIQLQHDNMTAEQREEHARLTGEGQKRANAERAARGEAHPLVGCPRPETSNAKASATLSNPAHPTQTPEAKKAQGDRMREINTGRVPSAEHRENLSAASTAYHASLTEEQKAERSRNISIKMRESAARRRAEKLAREQAEGS